MGSFFPVNAYWERDAPGDRALAGAIAGRVRSLGLAMSAEQGLFIELPVGGMTLFLDRRVGRRVEFELTGPDLASSFGEDERLRALDVLPQLIEGLVRDMGAAACFMGGVRRDHILGSVDAFDAAMTRWDGRSPIPFTLLGESAWLWCWRASLAADIAPQRVSGTVALAEGAPPSF